jgi:hypothetical protein
MRESREEVVANVTVGELAIVLQAMHERYRSLFDAISKRASNDARLEP